jgi:hypothetical protein
MGSVIECFMIERLQEAEASFRRFTYGDKAKCPCTDRWGHNAIVILGNVSYDDEPYEGRSTLAKDKKDDPRWPKTCEKCGYVFQPEDEWQYNLQRLYVRPETGEKTTTRKAPAGAMWIADGMMEFQMEKHPTPDGHFICVKTPGGEWNIDGQATGGGYWTRTGTPPKITARPSILIGNAYHGFLTDGKLVEC